MRCFRFLTAAVMCFVLACASPASAAVEYRDVSVVDIEPFDLFCPTGPTVHIVAGAVKVAVRVLVVENNAGRSYAIFANSSGYVSDASEGVYNFSDEWTERGKFSSNVIMLSYSDRRSFVGKGPLSNYKMVAHGRFQLHDNGDFDLITESYTCTVR